VRRHRRLLHIERSPRGTRYLDALRPRTEHPVPFIEGPHPPLAVVDTDHTRRAIRGAPPLEGPALSPSFKDPDKETILPILIPSHHPTFLFGAFSLFLFQSQELFGQLGPSTEPHFSPIGTNIGPT